MMNIHKTFLSGLFLDKNVAFHQKLFRDYHHTIFPIIENFTAFLEADTTERRVKYAKEISESVFFDMLYSPTASVFTDLLDTETNDQVISASAYTPQDHVVHSVNVYLLGVYLFFNHPIFHQRLWEDFSYELEDNRDICILDNFISAWKIFSFCHDLGYGFERLLNKKQKKEKSWRIKNPDAKRIMAAYYRLDDQIRYDRMMKAVATLLVVTAIVNRSIERRTFENRAFINKENTLLNNCTKQIGGFNKQQEGRGFSFCDRFTKLVHVYSESDLRELFPYISTEDVISIMRNDADQIVGIYYKSRFLFGPKFKRTSKVTTSYYCFDLDNVINKAMSEKKLSKYYNNEHWKEVADLYCESVLSLASSDGSGVHHAVFDVYRKLKEIYSFDDFNTRPEYNEWTEIAKKRIGSFFPTIDLSETLLQDIRAILNDCRSSMDYEVQFLQAKKKIIHYLKEKSTIESILGNLSPYENQKMEELFFLFTLFRDASEQYPKQYPKLFRYVDSGEECCVFTPLQYTTKQYKHYSNEFSEYSEYLSHYLSDLGIIVNNDLSLFLKYTPRFSPFDHGISSAHIVVCAAVCEQLFSEECHAMIESYISTHQSKHLGIQTSFLEAVGAIAVHNIYVETYKKGGGKDFILSFDNHPLAFFGAFCDTLQLWDRHYSVDQSRAVLSDFNPSGDHFGLNIQGNTIVLTCEYANEKKTGHYQRKNLRQFLLGADTLLKVNFIESSIGFFE